VVVVVVVSVVSGQITFLCTMEIVNQDYTGICGLISTYNHSGRVAQQISYLNTDPKIAGFILAVSTKIGLLSLSCSNKSCINLSAFHIYLTMDSWRNG
jgi:hypothetical protein